MFTTWVENHVARGAAAVSLGFCLVVVPCPAHAGPVVEQGLEAFLTFDEGAGSTTADLTGNGHTGTLVSTSWGSGHFVCDGEGQVVQIVAGPSLQSPSFTYELWFEAASNTGA